MLALLKEYQNELKARGLADLEVKPVPHPSGHKFVGTATCAGCHTEAIKVFAGTGHAKATDSLIHPPERSAVPRHFDPECLACHVTGWNPQSFTPYVTGYLGLEKTPKMQHNGCENCHGPGSEHVAAENAAADPKAMDKFRAEMRLSLKDKEGEKTIQRKCIECHDLDNSPNFHKEGGFDQYWKKVAHPGKG